MYGTSVMMRPAVAERLQRDTVGLAVSALVQVATVPRHIASIARRPRPSRSPLMQKSTRRNQLISTARA